MRLRQRLANLEAVAVRAEQGPWHRIIQEEGQSLRDAVLAYGAEKLEPNANLIVRQIISPGNPAAKPIGKVWREEGSWRELCGL